VIATRNAWVWTALLFVLTTSWVRAEQHPAQQLVEQTSERVLERLKRDREALRADPGLIFPLVEDLVLPHFDFEVMSRWVLGRYWRQASEEQKARFIEEFKGLLVRTYATALLEYSDQSIAYKPLLGGENADRVTVATEVVPSGGPRIPINYQLYKKGGEWKVYDIAVDGVSLLLNYRTSYGSEIRRHGLADLIERLAQRNGQLDR